MSMAYVIHQNDNVATALDACPAGRDIALLGEAKIVALTAGEEIRAEHKVALVDIPKDGAVIKYGMPIGHAVTTIKAGEWVHLHNCASNYDQHSNSLDVKSGAPTDTEYV